MVQIELGTGDSVRVVFAETDGEIVVEFSEDAIRLITDLSPTSGREGVVYEERFDVEPKYRKPAIGETVEEWHKRRILEVSLDMCLKPLPGKGPGFYCSLEKGHVGNCAV